MSTTTDLVRAFPWTKDYGGPSGDRMNGMSLRDYFAAAALTGLLARTEGDEFTGVASTAFDIADQMMKRRER